MGEHSDFRKKLGNIIFGHDTSASKAFDIILLILILIGSFIAIFESVASIRAQFNYYFLIAEYIILSLFLIEYILRIYSARNRRSYIFSFYGFIDFVAVVPALISFLFFSMPYLLLLRLFRLFRILRVLKILSFIQEESVLVKSLKHSIPKIIIFLSFVLIASTIFASVLYVVEGPENGFSDIPTSIYWAIVTLTTVGYGDIVPITFAGKFIASMLMIAGYGIIAIPTGIIVANYSEESRKVRDAKIKD
jgi:voltage-gated potassium channel